MGDGEADQICTYMPCVVEVFLADSVELAEQVRLFSGKFYEEL